MVSGRSANTKRKVLHGDLGGVIRTPAIIAWPRNSQSWYACSSQRYQGSTQSPEGGGI